MDTPHNYTVIGAGHGGKAMAAHLSLIGCRWVIYNRTLDHISTIRLRGGIHRTDYWRRGCSLDKPGVANLSVSELTSYVNTGQYE